MSDPFPDGPSSSPDRLAVHNGTRPATGVCLSVVGAGTAATGITVEVGGWNRLKPTAKAGRANLLFSPLREAIGADDDGAYGPVAPHRRVEHRAVVQRQHGELGYESVGEKPRETASQRSRAAARQVPIVAEPNPDPGVLGFHLVSVLVVDAEQKFSPVVEQAVLRGHPPPTGVNLRRHLRILDVDHLFWIGVEPTVLLPATGRRVIRRRRRQRQTDLFV